jgi:hypothetical protein
VNSKARRSDPTLMLAIFAGALLLAAWRSLSYIDPDRLRGLAPSAAPIALLATLIASALATHRLIATRKTLRSRSALAVVPADELKVTPDAVLRLAAQLTRADRTVAGWVDRRACAIRIRLTADSQGRLAYIVSGPSRTRELLRSALRGYHGIELRDAEEVLAGAGASGPEDAVLRTELILAHPSIEPLTRLGLEPDPLQPFASAISSLRVDRGERADVCVDLLPAIGWRHSRLRRRLRRQARRRYRERPAMPRILGGPGEGGKAREPIDLAERRDVASALDAKLRDAGPLFETQILIRVQAQTRPAAKATMRSLLGAFGPLAARNWFRASGLPIPGIAFLGSDLPPRRAGFDRRLASGRFAPARRSILTARELAGFLKPPTVDCLAENVLRSGALLAPAPALPTFKPEQRELIPLGRVADESGERLVGVRVADSFFSYIAGRSRYGKTELAIAQFVHLARRGHGGLFLDPHGDALERIKPYLTDPTLARRVVQIDLGPAANAASQPGWNLFELKGKSTAETEGRVEAVVDAFSSALEWGERNTRAINLTTQAAIALASIARVLPAKMAPTIFQIPTLLTDEEWREAALPFLPRASQRFWRDRFGRLAEEAITPLTNMVDRLRSSSAASTLLGQSESSYRAREAMDKGLIVLACPGSGGTRDRLLANLLVFDLFHAAKGRGNLPPDQRRLFFACLDEIQSFDGGSSSNLAALVEQTAKFGLRGIFLNQNPERLSAPTLNALTTNRSHLISTALNSHAATLLTREWGGEPSPLALSRLPRYRFIAQVTHQGDLSKPFSLGGVRVEEVIGEDGKPDQLDSLEQVSGEATARRSPAEALAHLEGLDDEILGDLKKRRRRGEVDEDPIEARSREDAEADPGYEPVSVPRGRS